MRSPLGRLSSWIAPVLLAALGCQRPAPLPTTVAPAGDAGVAALPAVPASGDAPRPIAFDPPLEARDVDPSRTTLSVTFDREMDREGWAWVTESAESAPEIGESSWDPTLRVNTAQVTLAPGRAYVVWVNSAEYTYFRDPHGRVVEPVRWRFSTAPAPALPAGIDTVSAHGTSGTQR